MKWAQKQKGFTIVELLIVIVVIAILAAITIVAYNGIQNRSKDASMRSAVSQVGKKILAYAPLNNDSYPAEGTYRTDLGLSADTAQATYDYYVSDDRKAFCVSVTNTTSTPLLAYSYTQNGTLVEGRCVKNLVVNPSFATDLNGWLQYQSTRTWVSGGVHGTGRLAIVRTAAATDAMSAQALESSAIEPNTPYRFSAWIWGDTAQTLLQFIGLQESAGTWRTMAVHFNRTITTTPTRYSASGTTPSDVLSTNRVVLRSANVDAATVYYDGVMLTKGATLYQYGDGSFPNWSWTGVPHASTSFGPTLPE